MVLAEGGAKLSIDGELAKKDTGRECEYPALYERFAEIVKSRANPTSIWRRCAMSPMPSCSAG